MATIIAHMVDDLPTNRRGEKKYPDMRGIIISRVNLQRYSHFRVQKIGISLRVYVLSF